MHPCLMCEWKIINGNVNVICRILLIRQLRGSYHGEFISYLSGQIIRNKGEYIAVLSRDTDCTCFWFKVKTEQKTRFEDPSR